MKGLSKHERIELRKREIGGKRRERKMEKHSDKFNEMFTFFFLIIRRNLCDFCGSDVSKDYKFILNPEGPSAKVAFKRYQNSEIENYTIETRHPNVLKLIIQGKRGLGLWFDQWSDGIADETFTKHEILEEFISLGIKLPKPFQIEFENIIWHKRLLKSVNDQQIHDSFKEKLFKNISV